MPSRRHKPADRTVYNVPNLPPYLSLRCSLRPDERPSSCFTTRKPVTGTPSTRRKRRALDSEASRHYTLRFLGGRHPLCGMGVVSLMLRISMPAVARARIADSRPAPGPFTRTSTAAHAGILGLVGRRQGRLLGGERRPLARAAKAQRAGTRPGDHVSHRVGEGDDGVVERRLHVDDPDRNVLLFLLLEGLLLGCLRWCFRHSCS